MRAASPVFPEKLAFSSVFPGKPGRVRLLNLTPLAGVPVGRTDRPWRRRPLCFRSAEGPLFERVSDAVGSVGWLPDGRAGLGRDEGQGQRAHVLAGGRGPRVPAQAGRVPGQAAGPAAGRQTPQVVQAAGGSSRQQGGAEELAEGAEDHDERAAVQVCVLRVWNYNSKTDLRRGAEALNDTIIFLARGENAIITTNLESNMMDLIVKSKE